MAWVCGLLPDRRTAPSAPTCLTRPPPPYLNSGPGNRVRDNDGSGSRFWATNELGDMRQWGSAEITLDASGNSVVNLPKAFARTHYPTVSMAILVRPNAAFIANQSGLGAGHHRRVCAAEPWRHRGAGAVSEQREGVSGGAASGAHQVHDFP